MIRRTFTQPASWIVAALLGAGVDPAAFRSVSIWCKRFSVSFGAASLG